jgi:hypothetical protein
VASQSEIAPARGDNSSILQLITRHSPKKLSHSSHQSHTSQKNRLIRRHCLIQMVYSDCCRPEILCAPRQAGLPIFD